MKTVNISDFKNRMEVHLDSLERGQNSIILKQSRHKKFVILSIDQYSSMMETLHLLSTVTNTKRLMESIEQHRSSLEYAPQTQEETDQSPTANVQKREILTLNREDGKFFVSLLKNPPRPSKRLRGKMSKRNR